MTEAPPTYSFGALPTDNLPPADELGELHAQLGIDPDAAWPRRRSLTCGFNEAAAFRCGKRQAELGANVGQRLLPLIQRQRV